MSDYQIWYENSTYDLHIQDMLNEANDLSSLEWEEAYWLGKCLYEVSAEEDVDEKVISSLVYASHCGLNMSTDSEKFLDAAQILARLYIRRNDYIRAANYLMDLSDRMDHVPDWVNLYYILSQILTDTIFRHTEDPYFLYKRLNSVSPDSYVQRAKVYQIFLKRLHDINETGTDRELNIETFEELKDKYIGNYLDEEEFEEDEFEEDEIEEENIDDYSEQGLEEVELNEDYLQSFVETQLAASQEAHQNEIELLQQRIIELENVNKQKDSELQELSQKVKDRDEALIRIRMGFSDVNEDEEVENDSDKIINLRRNEKILLIGALSAKVKDIIGISKLFGLKPENLDIVSDYDKITNFGNRITPGKYRAIIIGPTPHSVKDNNGESSLAQRILSIPDDFQYSVRCEDERGELRISKTSYKKALSYIAKMLDVV